MNKDEAELRYLCVEANHLYNFIQNVKQKMGPATIVPNLSYGLVAIDPIQALLRKENFPIVETKIGSSDAHSDNKIMGNQCIPLELTQPNIIIIDGTRNTGGKGDANNKYPDSQQGYLNYAIMINDLITSNEERKFANLMGVSSEHIKKLRETEMYRKQKATLENTLFPSGIKEPYAFTYWNPAKITLAIYNHGEKCETHTKSFTFESKTFKPQPTIFFVNSIMPDKYHTQEHKDMWGEHSPAYFDDSGGSRNKSFDFNERGIYLTSGIGRESRKLYEQMFVDRR